jgi:cation diffusion facilitator family transporter
MISLGLIWIGHRLFPDPKIHWLDPIAAIFVAVIILRAAYELTTHSIRDLMDVKLPPEEEDWIRNVIVSCQPSLHGFHQLRTRKAGHFRFIEFHMKVDPQMTVIASHNITRTLKQTIRQKFPHSVITIHIEPCDGECTDICAAGCLLAEEKRPRRQ